MDETEKNTLLNTLFIDIATATTTTTTTNSKDTNKSLLKLQYIFIKSGIKSYEGKLILSYIIDNITTPLSTDNNNNNNSSNVKQRESVFNLLNNILIKLGTESRILEPFLLAEPVLSALFIRSSGIFILCMYELCIYV